MIRKIPVDSDIYVDVIFFENWHVLHSWYNNVSCRTQPDGVDFRLFVNKDQGLLQLVKAKSKVLTDEVVYLNDKKVQLLLLI